MWHCPLAHITLLLLFFFFCISRAVFLRFTLSSRPYNTLSLANCNSPFAAGLSAVFPQNFSFPHNLFTELSPGLTGFGASHLGNGLNQILPDNFLLTITGFLPNFYRISAGIQLKFVLILSTLGRGVDLLKDDIYKSFFEDYCMNRTKSILKWSPNNCRWSLNHCRSCSKNILDIIL